MKSKLFMIVIAGMLFAAISAMAAVPPMMNFQGVLTDGAGVPIANDTKSVLFRIWDASAGGSIKWSETQNVMTDGQGNFRVLLGSITPIADAVFEQPDRWLGIKVDTDPELIPRAKLVSVGYSFRVSTIDGAVGGSISGNLELENSTSTSGNIYKNFDLFIHNFGSDNTYIGVNAGLGNASGIRNTGSGTKALANNSSGNSNTAYGAFALVENLSSDNTAIGSLALSNNTTAVGNTACGASALANNTTGVLNAAVGKGALRNSNGNGNTAMGHQALFANTSGGTNSAFGLSALDANTTGSTNTAIGESSMTDNTTGNSNAALGFSSLPNNTTGTANTSIGGNTLITNTIGVQNTALGYFADVSDTNLTNATVIGYNAEVNASNKIRLGNTSVTVIEGQVAYTFVSDKNLKENFQAVDGKEVLKKIRDFDLTSWNYIGNDAEKIRHYGPMAQDFFAAFGNDGVGTIGSKTTINTGDLVGILMIAVQTLSKENEQMRSQNADLDARLKALETQLKKLSEKKLASR